MLTAVFQGKASFIAFASIAVLLLATVGYVLGRRFSGRPWAVAAFVGAVSTELALTLFLPSGGPAGSGGTGACIINRNFAEPFATEQGLLNILLFLPIGFFGVMAFRTLLPVLAGSVLLTIATELLQTLVPGISRGCDSSDVEMNTLGAVVGLLLAWALLHLTGRHVNAPKAHAGPTTIGAGIGLGCAAVVWLAWITPTAVDATSLQFTGSKEKEAVTQAIRQAFGERYKIVNVQLSAGAEDVPDSLFITLDHGSAELSWPDAAQLNVTLEDSSITTENSFPIPGTRKKPAGEHDALALARRYAQEHYPRELHGAEPQVTAVGEKAELGWIASWRRRNTAGVLMPMRLDIQINTAGRISQMLINTTPDPTALPQATISEKAAQKTALAYAEHPKGPDGLHPVDSELLAVQRDGHWRTQWITTFAADDPTMQLEPVYVDASTGKVTQRATQNQELPPPSADGEAVTETITEPN